MLEIIMSSVLTKNRNQITSSKYEGYDETNESAH